MVKFNLDRTEFHDLPKDQGILKIYWMNLYDDEGEQYGELRIDITPYLASIHPILWNTNLKTLRRLEKDVIECASPIVVDQYGFKEVYITTRSSRLPKLISKRMEHVKDDVDGTGFNLWRWRL